jgi:hypothetical protein
MHAMEHIDYLAINGSALPVLQSINWNNVLIYVISCEPETSDSGTFKNLLNQLGFGRETRYSATQRQVWVNKENKPL